MGIKIYGTPWIPYEKTTAFGVNDTFIKEKFSQIPSDIDILITHTPAYSKFS